MAHDDPFGLPPVNGDLRAAAARLRENQAPERPRSGPPEENGVRITAIARGDDEELRLSWAEYNGRKFLNIRVWKKAEDGTWWPEKGKGLTVRTRELPAFADGIAKAVELALQEGRHG
jgi:hypothetical protein